MAGFSLWKAALGIFVGYFSLKVASYFYRTITSPLRRLRGPPNSSFVFGNLEQIRNAETEVVTEWFERYGSVMRIKTFLGKNTLYTTDTRAINHILTHSADYQKPQRDRSHNILGEGVLFAEGDKHRQQRRIMNPTFGPAAIKALVPVFLSKSFELVDGWKAQLDAEAKPTKTIEVMRWLSSTTLDIIGLAGFDYKFDSLNPHGRPNELNEAFSSIFKGGTKMQRQLFLLGNFIPGVDRIVKLIPSKRRLQVREARATMDRIGAQLLSSRKQTALGKTVIENSSLSDLSLEGHDLLTTLMRSNLDTSLPESQRMSDKEVLDQVPTFLVAGHETTSTQTTWCLYELACHPHIQERLRAELFSINTDSPTADELNDLPYLDAIVRETLRFHAAVPNSIRIAMRDDVIPVSEPYFDRYGKTHTEIKMRKGETIIIPARAINILKDIWGTDACEFNPDRWQSVPENAKAIPGVWGHVMTFLGGSRGCIGYRFALYEMKALLFAMLRNFKFELTVPADEIDTVSTIVSRPCLKSDRKAGPQLPLRVTSLTP